MKTFLSTTITLLVSLGITHAGVFDFLGLGKAKTNNTAAASVSLPATLTEDRVIQGLKEALGIGVQQAVNRLGHDGGFLTNLNVRIPLPEKLRKAETTLRVLRQEKLADEFVRTMNHAAEQAVPEATGVFVEALKGMSITDAKNILVGTNNAATQYFRTATQTNLFNKFLPIVKKATDQTGVTSTYKRLMEKASTANMLGPWGRSLLNAQTVDVDAYVTNMALDGLFKMVAEEEQRIRENPLARTSDLLQSVFGVLTK